MENATEVAKAVEITITNWGPTLAVAGAFFSAALAGIGSTIGVGITGQAGAAVTAEKPESFGITLILEALPGTKAIYGLIGAFLIINFFLGNPDFDPLINTQVGLQIFLSSLPLGITAFTAAIYQGKIATAGLHALTRNASIGGKMIILAIMIETFALLGLLASFLLLNNLKMTLLSLIA